MLLRKWKRDDSDSRRHGYEKITIYCRCLSFGSFFCGWRSGIERRDSRNQPSGSRIHCTHHYGFHRSRRYFGAAKKRRKSAPCKRGRLQASGGSEWIEYRITECGQRSGKFCAGGRQYFKIFAADFLGQMLVPGSLFTLSVAFADDSTADQSVIIP